MTAPGLPRPTRPRPHRLGDLADAHGLRPAAGTTSWRDVTVAGVTADNRRVTGGELFAGCPGARVHGARFAAEAVRAGAAALLTDPAGAALLAGSPGVPVLVADDVRSLLGGLAATVYDHPGERLRTFAVTGTNGKTTTAYMVEHALRALGRTTGLIGTVELRVAGRSVPATLTTPQADELQAALAAMVEAGVTDLVMEVSSHALALGRVDPLVFDVAGFTNLTQDHLDFHRDLEDYFAAKASLFTPERSRAGVAVADDDFGRRLAARERVAGLGLTGRTSDWWVETTDGGAGGDFTLHGPDGVRLRTRSGLPGHFNVANAALAAAMVLTAGVPADELAEALGDADGLAPTVPGRMEQLADEPRVVVDFAHNPDALAQAIAALRPGTRGRLVVLVGAAGERDRDKRPVMGRVAAEGADVVVVTDDDPHDEPAAPIRAAVLAGARAVTGADVREIGDRRAAIRAVVTEAAPEDTVLVAGRGHETVQEVAGVAHELDDRVEVRAALAARREGTR